MKVLFVLTISMSISSLAAQPPALVQPPSPVVRAPLADHPNLDQNLNALPAPNPPNPYDPYGTKDGKVGSAFSNANSASMHFINIIDNQVYSGAWLDAGGVVHDIMPQKTWAEGMRASRSNLGPVKARKVIGHEMKKSLQGGFEGNFMVIKYATQFANRPNATETVTLMMHAPLGIWKVVSYHVD